VSGQSLPPVAKLLADAANAAGDWAVAAGKEGNYTKAALWAAISGDVDAAMRRAIELMAE
jgi:head-tail adaptor